MFHLSGINDRLSGGLIRGRFWKVYLVLGQGLLYGWVFSGFWGDWTSGRFEGGSEGDVWVTREKGDMFMEFFTVAERARGGKWEVE